ncbi:aldo/keto reductase [Streptomyces griseofuscus]|uniref:aldo/keto reductase n=1 Tax=Streptomyces griseofuscus TaxID=146922 RepID=UPI001FABFC27|nr:aldo/keto reductase [Streptomyces griseofuscus]
MPKWSGPGLRAPRRSAPAWHPRIPHGCRSARRPVRSHRHAQRRSALAARQLREERREAVDRLAEIAAASGSTVSQLALASILTRGEHIVPIPGTRSPRRIQENTGAADLTLTDTEIEAIDEILPRGCFGARYTKGHVPVWI